MLLEETVFDSETGLIASPAPVGGEEAEVPLIGQDRGRRPRGRRGAGSEGPASASSAGHGSTPPASRITSYSITILDCIGSEPVIVAESLFLSLYLSLYL